MMVYPSVKRDQMKFLLVGTASLGAWMILAFWLAIPSGWVHLPLAVGTVLIAIGVVTGRGKSAGENGH